MNGHLVQKFAAGIFGKLQLSVIYFAFPDSFVGIGQLGYSEGFSYFALHFKHFILKQWRYASFELYSIKK